MPTVSGNRRKKAPAKARKAVASRAKRKSPNTQRGVMENAGAAMDALMHTMVQKLVAYTAVGAAAVAIFAVMMLFLGGYFNDIGGHADNLAKTAAKSAGFEVERITVKGRAQARKIEIVNALYDETYGQALGQSLLHYSPQAARARLEQVGWIKHAAVVRLWPNTLHVSVVERTPAALWQRTGTGELYLIDEEGVVITPVAGHQYTGLPMVVDMSEPIAAKGILQALAPHPELFKRISGLRQQGDRRWDLIFRNDFVVMLPETEFEAAISRLAQLESVSRGNSRPSQELDYLDMRNPKTVYYKPRA